MGSKKKKSAKGSRDLADFIAPYRIDDPASFHLNRHDCAAKGGLDKDKAKDIIEANRERLSDLQERLYAEDRWSVLVIFQGLDAAGKDSAIEHVMHGVNPQGCDVHSFKVPTSHELDHDFMWRALTRLPERGRIGIFNRSYYEELLVVRVHPDVLAKERIPKPLVTRHIWKERFEDINNIEKYLARNGTLILKFFLHTSKEEQRQRFLERLEQPAKRWKFSMGDIAERALWDKYQAAYQDMIRHTSTPHARWHVVPADHKWMARVVIGSAIVDAIERIDPQYPKPGRAQLAEFKRVQQALESESPKATGKEKARLRRIAQSGTDRADETDRSEAAAAAASEPAGGNGQNS
jgi:PPK2 family polyphosphate:nucleotide phosphotransferase